MSTKINYDLLAKARVMLFAAHGWPVECKCNGEYHLIPAQNNVWDWYKFDYRIALPPIPYGWRLVELGEEIVAYQRCRVLHIGDKDWQNEELFDMGPNTCTAIQSFAITPSNKPKPRKVSLTKADWDGHPVWWVRNTVGNDALVSAIGPNSIMIVDRKEHAYHVLKRDQWQRSHDRINWTPCYKEEAHDE
jgi:hypothetical protein